MSAKCLITIISAFQMSPLQDSVPATTHTLDIVIEICFLSGALLQKWKAPLLQGKNAPRQADVATERLQRKGERDERERTTGTGKVGVAILERDNLEGIFRL